MDKNKLFIANLPWSITSDKLRELFSQYGEIVNVELITDRNTGRSRGFGFVTFANAADAQKAIDEINGKEIDERKIIVNIARPREDRGAKGGFKKYRNRNY
ncbi:MAG: RNA-binding protein [Candidatus Levybacteria bacterium]|nr:RNA-binding protein [Candidatus Levybacteria bacterium]